MWYSKLTLEIPEGEHTLKSKYVVALPIFAGAKGFCHPTILVSAISEADAISLVRYLIPNSNIGDIKKVQY